MNSTHYFTIKTSTDFGKQVITGRGFKSNISALKCAALEYGSRLLVVSSVAFHVIFEKDNKHLGPLINISSLKKGFFLQFHILCVR